MTYFRIKIRLMPLQSPPKNINCIFYNIYKSLNLNQLPIEKIFEKKLLKIRLLKKMIVILHSKLISKISNT